MTTKPLQIILISALDDPLEESDVHQAELHSFYEELRENGFTPSCRIRLIEAINHDVSHQNAAGRSQAAGATR